MNEDHFATYLNMTNWGDFVTTDISVQLRLVWSAHTPHLCFKKNTNIRPYLIKHIQCGKQYCSHVLRLI